MICQTGVLFLGHPVFRCISVYKILSGKDGNFVCVLAPKFDLRVISTQQETHTELRPLRPY